MRCGSRKARSTRRFTDSKTRDSSSRSWGTSENNRQAKFYALTPRGRRTLRVESDSWVQYAAAITKVITATKQPA